MLELEAADRRLLESLDRTLGEGAKRAGRHLACRPGCIECCLGPFPITMLDAWRLRRALRELEQQDERRALAIRARAREVTLLMLDSFPGDPQTGLLSGDQHAQEEFFERYSSLPCPVLGPATNLCELYQARPISCRTYGLPVRIGREDLPPCRLCFAHALPEEIEASRVVIDPEGLEDALLDQLGEGETIVAFALALP